jgi:hypothetical protein
MRDPQDEAGGTGTPQDYIHRRSGRVRNCARAPGPITTEARGYAWLVLQLAFKQQWWLWVPAFAGTTAVFVPAL